MREWFGRVPVDVLADRRVSDGAVATFAALALYAFPPDFVARVSWSTVAELRGVGRRTVARHVAELIECGHVVRENGGYRLWITRGVRIGTGANPDHKGCQSCPRPSYRQLQQEIGLESETSVVGDGARGVAALRARLHPPLRAVDDGGGAP